MKSRTWLLAGPVVGALALTTWWNVQAAPVMRPPQPLPAPNTEPAVKPIPKPQALRKLNNPAGTAKAAAALARFANGQLGADAYDQRVAKVLGAQPGAQQTAKRLVQTLEAMAPAERSKVFPGVAKTESLTTNKFDRLAYEKVIGKWDLPLASVTTLPPDPYNPKEKAQYELVYRGLKSDAVADADGTDEPAVYVNVMSRSAGKYVSNPKYVPGAGTTTATAGAFVADGAGQVWSSPLWPSGWNDAIVIVTAVIEDNGDLDQRKQELELLLQFAMSETEEDNVTQDRMEVLRREVDDALALLHLANPDRWSPKAVQVRKLTSAEYDALYLQASTAAPAPHKLTAQHDPRGSSYTLYFDIPPPAVSFKTVYLKVKELEALGADKDAGENKIADLGVNVSINGNTAASTTRRFSKNKNLVTPGWTVEREVQAGRTVSLHIQAFDDDPPPDCACASVSGGLFGGVCTSFCSTAEKKEQCKGLINLGGYSSAYYAGTCPRRQIEYDINPLPDSGEGWGYSEYHEVDFTYDLATNKLAGDVSGNPGTFTVIGTDGQGIKARIVFEVGVK